MTNAVAEQATTTLGQLNTVLAGWEAQPIADADWLPGDPLYDDPRASDDHEAQCVRPMVEVLPIYESRPRCGDCEVSWSGTDPCWVCGAEATERPTLASLIHATFNPPRALAEAIRASDDFARVMADALRVITDLSEHHGDLMQHLVDTGAQGVIWREPSPRHALPRGFTVVRFALDECFSVAAPSCPRRLPIDGTAYRQRRRARKRRTR